MHVIKTNNWLAQLRDRKQVDTNLKMYLSMQKCNLNNLGIIKYSHTAEYAWLVSIKPVKHKKVTQTRQESCYSVWKEVVRKTYKDEEYF